MTKPPVRNCADCEHFGCGECHKGHKPRFIKPTGEYFTDLNRPWGFRRSCDDFKREHITDGSPCWCDPETTYTDPETGASVIVHKELQ